MYNRQLGFFEEIGVNDAVEKAFAQALDKRVPNVNYFPTFLFDFPERIYLLPPSSGRDKDEKLRDEYYKALVDSYLLKSGYNSKDQIIDRIQKARADAASSPSWWTANMSQKRNITSVLQTLEREIGQTVFQAWDEVFGDRKGSTSLGIDLDFDDPTDPSSGIYISFHIRDGDDRFEIAERSLGFRWFFSFLLFTKYAAGHLDGPGTLFLFDEPASNLHPLAQAKLMSIFPDLAGAKNRVIYSTHSHYMIDPSKIEYVNIVENSEIGQTEEQEITGGWRKEHTTISVTPYRKFVATYGASRTNYFQPVLDTLAYAPSRLELPRKAIFVEGKGDRALFSSAIKVLSDPDGIAVINCEGAGGFGTLIALYQGWAWDFIAVLDDDQAGRKNARRYRKELGLSKDIVFTLGEANDELKDKELEDILTDDDKAAIATAIGVDRAPTKEETTNFLMEVDAGALHFDFSEQLLQRVQSIISKLTI